ncbi:MAG: phytanoyl-CoA dioxygenase family protein [Mycobacteriales bacterium]
MSGASTILADEVRNRGFAVWPDFASSEQRDELKKAADILATGEHAHHYPKSIRVWDLYQHDSIFIEMIAHPGLADLLDNLLGQHHLLSDYSLNVVNPGQPIDDWHIDYPYNEMQAIVTGGILGLQCVLALGHFTDTNGATCLLPGSHMPPRRPGEPLPTSAETFTAEPGALLIMAAATWHRSGYNSSRSPRTAILMSFVERWIRPMSDPLPPNGSTYNQRLQIMLGLQRPPETINGVPI